MTLIIAPTFSRIECSRAEWAKLTPYEQGVIDYALACYHYLLASTIHGAHYTIQEWIVAIQAAYSMDEPRNAEVVRVLTKGASLCSP